jgi:hypothetical protein
MIINLLQLKPHFYIPRKGIARPQSQFSHSCVFERLMYLCRQTNRGNMPRNSFSGIYVSNFRYCVFAVWASNALRGLLNMNAKKELTFRL